MATSQQVLREYLLSLGFKINTQEKKNFDSALEKTAKSASLVGGALIAAAGTVAVMAQAYANSMEKLRFASLKTGESANHLSAFSQAMEQFGIDGTRAQGIIERLAQSSRDSPVFKEGLVGQLGMAPGSEKLGDVEFFLKGMKAILDSTLDTSLKIGQAEQAFGISSDEYALIAAGNLDAQIAKYQAINAELERLKINKNRIGDQTHDWNNALRDVGNSMSRLQDILGEGVAPTLIGLVDSLKDVVDSINSLLRGGPLEDFIKLNTITGPGAEPGRWISDKLYEWFNGTPASPTPAKAPGPAPTGRPNTLGFRSHNPGNLHDLHDRERVFASDDEGLFAEAEQLDRNYGRGANTIAKMVEAWTPWKGAGNSQAKNAAYAQRVSQAMGGLDVNAKFGRDMIPQYMMGMVQGENGSNPFSLAQMRNVTTAAGITQNIDIHVTGGEDAGRRIHEQLADLAGNTGRDLTPAIR